MARRRTTRNRSRQPLSVFRADVAAAQKRLEALRRRALAQLEREVRTLERERQALRAEVAGAAFIEQFLLQRSLPNVIAGIRDEVERRMYPP